MEKTLKWIRVGLWIFTIIFMCVVFYGTYYSIKKDRERTEIKK